MSELITYTAPPPARSADVADWLLTSAEIAQRIGGTDFVPEALRNNPAAITAALMYGREAGLGPMQSLAKIAVINGRPTLAAEAQRALIRGAGHRIWFEESTTTRCIACGQRAGEDEISRVTWTIDDATRANLAGKPPWRMYPRQMLKARASAELARDLFPDVIGGLAATEEAEDAPPPADNGTEPAAATTPTRRRRRATPSEPASPDVAKPEPEPEPAPAEPAPEPATAPEPPTEPEPTPQPPADESVPPRASEAGGLPAAEQALIDQARQELGATERPAEPMTDPQRRKIQALFRDKGITDRAERLQYAGGVVGRELATSNELSKDEAGQVIEHLDQYDPDNPQTHPLPDTF